MPNSNENVSMQNNSMHTNTPNCESVEILFGLTPNQIYYASGRFFDISRMCSVALMEMLEAIQHGHDTDEDISTLIVYTKTMKIMVELERLTPVFANFISYFNSIDNDPNWLDKMDDSERGTELRETVMSLHYGLLGIANAIDKVGFITFSADAAGCFSEITTKQAYDDIVCAMSCIHSIYIAYIKNRYSCQVKQCVIKSKN